MSKTSTVKGGREGTTQAGSRAGLSKSRVEKSRPLVVPIPEVIVEIVPGRFTEEDWMYMLTLEDDEDMEAEIIYTLNKRVMDECFQAYLTRQMMPYTLSQAKDTMTQKVNLIFMHKEEGILQEEEERTWQDEEEPWPCFIDFWMGELPPNYVPWLMDPSISQSKVVMNEAASQKMESEPEATKSVTELELYSPLIEPKILTIHELKNGAEKLQQMTPPAQIPQPTLKRTPPLKPLKKRYQPHSGPLRSAGLRNIAKTLDETEQDILKEQHLKMREEEKEDSNLNLLPTSLHNILKIQLGRPPQKRDVIYDALGNVLSMPKLDPSTFPQRRVQPQVEVFEPVKEPDSKGKTSVQLGGKRVTQDQRSEKRSMQKRFPAAPVGSQKMISSGRSQRNYFISTSLAEATTLPIPLSAGIQLDSMPLTPGVIVRGNNKTERGSLPSLQLKERKEGGELKPIQPVVPLPSIPVEQFIKNHVPHVRPISILCPPNRAGPVCSP